MSNSLNQYSIFDLEDQESFSRIYNKYGFVIFKNIFDSKHIQNIEDAILSITHQERKRLENDYSEREIPQNNKSINELILEMEKINKKYVSKIYDFINSHPALYSIVSSKKLSQIISQLIYQKSTNQLIVNGFQLRMDLPRNKSELLGWHRDYDYFPGFSSKGVVTWIPLHDIDSKTGGISIIPKKFKESDIQTKKVIKKWEGRKDHTTFEIANLNDLKRESLKPIRIFVKKTDIVLFNMCSIHKSEPNIGEKIRWTAQIRWYPSDDKCFVEKDRAALENL